MMMIVSAIESKPTGAQHAHAVRRRCASRAIGAFLKAGFRPKDFPIYRCGAADAQLVGRPHALSLDTPHVCDYNVSTFTARVRFLMSTIVKSRIIKIGNSQGVRIPKVLLEQLNFTGDVELEVQDTQLIVRATAAPRANWAAQFERMAAEHDDTLIDPSLPPTDWEEREWEW